MSFEKLKLKNQLCFPLYAASRLVIRQYQPLLEKLELTYPQYLVLLVLWETDGLTVNQIASTLVLNTNTITPLLKRMEKQQLLERKRMEDDERKVLIKLTDAGKKLKLKAQKIPESLVDNIGEDTLTTDEYYKLKEILGKIIIRLNGIE
ncbi:MAG: MarR family transcriptional regulator [Bacteroidales bacterium]|nr:MarR family transcriptional regulator [Bacteroidales bacterium]MBN2819569.1 MarR family transcriptional regulator [Bacteroidales bacterium]